MPDDPFHIPGLPDPAEDERERVIAFSRSATLPVNIGRFVLLAAGDEAAAQKLLRNPKWFARHLSLEGGKMSFDLSGLDLTRGLGDVTKRTGPSFRDEQKKEAARVAARDRVRRGTTINDPTLGRLIFDDAWKGQIDLPPFGEKLQLRVEVDEEDEGDSPPPPTDRQREAFRSVADNASALYAEAERASFDYYNDVKDESRSLLGKRAAAKRVPELDESTDIWRLLDGPDGITVSADEAGCAISVALGYSCTWDEEHGHYLTFDNGKLANVGHL